MKTSDYREFLRIPLFFFFLTREIYQSKQNHTYFLVLAFLHFLSSQGTSLIILVALYLSLFFFYFSKYLISSLVLQNWIEYWIFNSITNLKKAFSSWKSTTSFFYIMSVFPVPMCPCIPSSAFLFSKGSASTLFFSSFSEEMLMI